MATELNYFFPLIELGRALKPQHRGFFLGFFLMAGGRGMKGGGGFHSRVVLPYLAGQRVSKLKVWA